MRQGTVVRWVNSYGFIRPRVRESGHGDIFVHAGDVAGCGVLSVGDEVEYEVGYDYGGRRRAVRVIRTDRMAA